MNGEKMAATELTFHNQIKLRVQAQIFLGRTLISTCLANPGEVCVLLTESTQYDIFFKNGATGREIARRLNNEADSLTLILKNGRYILT
jgi:3'-phosphoadenosine 5'-phosphosulfate sulfotransferase